MTIWAATPAIEVVAFERTPLVTCIRVRAETPAIVPKDERDPLVA